MGISINAEYDDGGIKKLFKGLESGLIDFREPLRECGTQVIRSTDKTFQQQGRPTQWDELSDLTLMNRRKGGAGAKILQDSGRLKNSITAQGQGSINKLTADELLIGTNVKYAAIHQVGDTIKAKNKPYLVIPAGKTKKGKKKFIKKKQVTIPARPFLIVQPEDTQRFGNIFAAWTARQIQKFTSGG